jgi:pimeloyl-ACP methyl ester carboxylesterase
MLAAMPAPMHQDIQSAQYHHGLEIGGDELTKHQYYPALRRFLELARDAANGASSAVADPPRGAPRVGQLSKAVGRYVYVEVHGVEYRMYFEEHGPADGSGIPLVLQHTAGADGRQWRHVLEDTELARHFRVIAYDLPYHGKSLPPEGLAWWAREYRLEREWLMDTVVAFSEALGLVRPVYMGSSIGGHLAADLARYRPEHFRAVIGLEAGHATPGGYVDWLHHPAVSNDSKASVMAGVMSPQAPEAYRRETSFVYSQGWPRAFKGDIYYYCVDHDLTDEAHNIDTTICEVHLLNGSYDYGTPPAAGRALADDIKGASFQEMEGLGHFPMSEDPQRFLGYIRPVLTGIRERLG